MNEYDSAWSPGSRQVGWQTVERATVEYCPGDTVFGRVGKTTNILRQSSRDKQQKAACKVIFPT